MRDALVFGGSGQIGVALLARLLPAGWRVHAVSRSPRESQPGLHWLCGQFGQTMALPDRVDAIFSLGPLDRFAQWYAQGQVSSARVVAFGSTSLETKQASSDDYERDLAARLETAEAEVFRYAAARAAHATLLRPTLIYGGGHDKTLTRIAAMARRTGFFVLPSGARGLRQPVHVADLADAALAVVDRPATYGRHYALPGGETLAYRQMVKRTLAALQPPARLIEVPAPLFRAMLWAARRSGRMQGLSDAAVNRMREDMVFDAQPAAHDFGYAPRPFQPDPAALGLL
jgi:nucleoside-diphosphate-sugar epimerase